MEINSDKGKEVQSQDSLQVQKHVPSKTQQKIKSFKKGDAAEWQHPLQSSLLQRHHTGTWPMYSVHTPYSNPCSATHPCRLCQVSITQLKSPPKWAKYNSSIFPQDSQVKVVQQQISRVKEQETQDCIATSRGGKGMIPFFGGKVLLYHPGHLWNAMLRS